MDSTSLKPRIAVRIVRWAGLALLLIVPTTYVGISVVTAEILTRPSNHASTIDPRRVGLNATAWSTRTADGLTLRGWYYPTERRRQLIVLVHGMGGCWEELAALGRDLHRQGYDLLLFDLRGHGESDPSRLFMGRRERADIRAVLTWAARAGFAPDRVGWLGHSMGASTLLMEAANNPAIRVAVMDSPYGNLPELLQSQLTRHSHLPSWFNPGILIAAQVAFGVRTDDLVPIRSARSWGDRPLLLIHGEADTIVPVHQARALARAVGPACLTVTLPGVEHVQAYRDDPVGYVSEVDSFFHRHLRP
jgi:pimeloyl-ACP methyl ester carboxylesterase